MSGDLYFPKLAFDLPELNPCGLKAITLDLIKSASNNLARSGLARSRIYSSTGDLPEPVLKKVTRIYSI
jgi:hypothetical protein